MPAGVSARNHPRYSPGAPSRGAAVANAIRKSAKKVQRFLRLGQFTLAHLWPSLLVAFLKHHVRSTSPIYLAIDRTAWGQVNLLMVSLVWQKRSIPVYWQQLARLGNSNEQQQIAVLTKALALLAGYRVVVLGDREFCSVDLARWLGEQGVYFCLRQKQSTYLKSTESDWQRLGELPLTPGSQMFFNTAIVAKGKGFDQAHLAAKWKRRYRGFAPDEPWYLLTNLAILDDAISAYQKRFDIEEMFRDFKGEVINSSSVKLRVSDSLPSFYCVPLPTYVRQPRVTDSNVRPSSATCAVLRNGIELTDDTAQLLSRRARGLSVGFLATT